MNQSICSTETDCSCSVWVLYSLRPGMLCHLCIFTCYLEDILFHRDNQLLSLLLLLCGLNQEIMHINRIRIIVDKISSNSLLSSNYNCRIAFYFLCNMIDTSHFCLSSSAIVFSLFSFLRIISSQLWLVIECSCLPITISLGFFFLHPVFFFYGCSQGRLRLETYILQMLRK